MSSVFVLKQAAAISHPGGGVILQCSTFFDPKSPFCFPL